MSELIVITGASSGIGRALALLLASHGKKILAIARRESALTELKENNPDMIEILAADIATEEGRQRVVSSIPGDMRISALVNNAAIMKPSGPLKEISLTEWRYQIAVNVEAPLFLTTALIPFLHGGRVLNLTIYSSFRVTEGLAAYGVSKSALNMLTEYLRIELKKENIYVGSVLPGIVDTPIQNQLPTATHLYLRDRINKLKNTAEVLSSEESAIFISGLLLDTNNEAFSSKVWDIYRAPALKFEQI